MAAGVYLWLWARYCIYAIWLRALLQYIVYSLWVGHVSTGISRLLCIYVLRWWGKTWYAFMETSTIQLGDDDGSVSRYPLPLTVLTKESIDDLPGIHGSRVGHVPWTHGSWVPPKVTYPGSGSERVLAVLKVQAQEPRPRMRLFTTFCQF